MRRTEIIDAYLEGTEALESLAFRVPDEKWNTTTPCTEWSAQDLVGHVLCVAEDYNAFVDSVVGSRTGPLLLHEDLEEHNAQRLESLPPGAPLARLASFGLMARQFARRVRPIWDTIVLHSRGMPWTVGRHTGFCALEWHIHAWDLAQSMGWPYRPGCLDTLAQTWTDSLPHLPLHGGDPWTALLYASGRQPDLVRWQDAS